MFRYALPFSSRLAIGVAAMCSVAIPASVVIAPASVSALHIANDPGQSAVGLSLGSTGPAVTAVQQALITAGIPVAGGADGVFGAMTAKAVREFQITRGITPSGTITQETQAALGLGGSPASRSLLPLSQGSSGAGVRVLQEQLMAAGFTILGGADGVFGPMTATALADFQRSRQLAGTGVFDMATAVALVGRTPGAPASGTTSVTPPATAGTAPAAPATVAELVGLTVGQRGPRVRALQTALMRTGLTFLGGADGIFGPATSNALRIFQSNRGLAVTGSVDEATAVALGAVTGAAPVATPTNPALPLLGLAPGTSGPLVRDLQTRLLSSGLTFRGGADGIFGPATANALRTFQANRGLNVSGRVDEPTAQALAAITPGTPSAPTAPAAPAAPSAPATPAPSVGTSGYPTFGEQGDRVRQLQQALINAGIALPGGADGIFGAMTAGAVMNFQRQMGLATTGVVDDATAQALGLAAGAAPAQPEMPSSVTMEFFPMQGTCSFSDTWHAPRGGGRLHEGTDVMAPEGRLIYAVTSGRISQMYHDFPGSRAGNGLRLALPDGTYFFYAHLQGFAEGIAVGTEVRAGQILGYNGTTGNAGVPHLHFEIHPGGGAPINPYPSLKAIDGCRNTTPPPQP